MSQSLEAKNPLSSGGGDIQETFPWVLESLVGIDGCTQFRRKSFAVTSALYSAAFSFL